MLQPLDLLSGRLLAQKRQLQGQLSRLEALAQGEMSLQQQYEDVVNNHMQDKAAHSRDLQEKIKKVRSSQTADNVIDV